MKQSSGGKNEAVIPTLVHHGRPTKTASICGAPITTEFPTPQKMGRSHREFHQVALPPTIQQVRSLNFQANTKEEEHNSKVDNAFNISLGWIHPSTLGPTSAPARISPTIPGWPKRSNSSARSWPSQI